MSMTERQHQERRAWREQLAAEAAAEQAERQRPIITATETLAKTHAALIQVERENVLAGRDDSFAVDDGVKNASMSQEAADRFNGISADSFVENTPLYYPSPENHEILCDYLTRNGCMIANGATWRKAYERLNSLGLLQTWPEPESFPEPLEEPERLPESHEGYPTPHRQEPLYVDGWDWTGEPKRITAREADAMSAEEYRRFLHIPRIQKIERRRE
jgi:hypothetical protein